MKQVKLLFFLLVLTASWAYSLDDGISQEDVQEAVQDGLAEVESMLELEREMDNRADGSSHQHSRMMQSRPSAREAALRGAKTLFASKKLAQKFNWSAKEARKALPRLSLEGTDLKNSCPESITCQDDEGLNKYRPIDGSCHNRLHPDWGKSETPFQRMLPPAYADGVWTPRWASSSNGSALDGPRQVSTTFIKVGGPDETSSTLMLMTWGQFITHDLTKASSYTSTNGQTPQCCNATSGGPLPTNLLHPYCLPIAIPADDEDYSPYKQTCMSFVRTQTGADFSCTMGHAEQLNSLTHWLDASTVYGSDAATLATLRAGQDGLLLTTSSSDGTKELLPLAPGCKDPTCYYAGDVRAQENPQLAVTHTLMMREHNRLARELKNINPKWDDEILFQEARRILTAEIQHITYNEYLPALLGNETMIDYKLTTAPMGTFSVYNDSTARDPSILNEFAAAVYRVGHSQVQGFLSLYTENDEPDPRSFALSDYFFNASLLAQPGFIDNAMRGLTKQMPNQINPSYTKELTFRLFKGSKAFGLDLVALNIQRGREHGVPDYNTVRVKCGLPKANSFDDLSGEINSITLDSLREAYKSVDDIDLYIGCLAEGTMPVKGSLLGATSLCVIGQQFALTKNNDRFFYDVGNQPSSFTREQLDTIRQTSLARLMCDNSDGNFTKVQPMVFKAPDGTNEKVACSEILSVDLNLWQDPTASPASKSYLWTRWLLAVLPVSIHFLFRRAL